MKQYGGDNVSHNVQFVLPRSSPGLPHAGHLQLFSYRLASKSFQHLQHALQIEDTIVDKDYGESTFRTDILYIQIDYR